MHSAKFDTQFEIGKYARLQYESKYMKMCRVKQGKYRKP